MRGEILIRHLFEGTEEHAQIKAHADKGGRDMSIYEDHIIIDSLPESFLESPLVQKILLGHKPVFFMVSGWNGSRYHGDFKLTAVVDV